MWKRRRLWRHFSWRSTFIVLLVFIPVAFLVSFLPGWWWYVGMSVYLVSLCRAANVLSVRDERRFADRNANPS